MNAFELTLNDYKVLCNGDCGYTILFTHPSSRELTKKILSVTQLIKKELNTLLIDSIPSYQSLTLVFNPIEISRKNIELKLKSALTSTIEYCLFKVNCIEIPVCYSPEYAPDIQRVAEHCKISTDEIVKQHTETLYWVAMLGFLPGFIYLSGLKKSLYCPRKESPSLSISPGSIAIGDKQTGLYSLASPGGWNVIGRTPIQLLTNNAEKPIVFSPLDEIKFVSISEQAFVQIKNESIGNQ